MTLRPLKTRRSFRPDAADMVVDVAHRLRVLRGHGDTEAVEGDDLRFQPCVGVDGEAGVA